MRACGVALVLTALSIAAPFPAVAQSEGPLAALLKSDGDTLCFRRDYDAAHLKNHPRQATQSALASFKRDGFRMMLRQNGRDHYIIAGCGWEAQANRDVQGKPILPSFKGRGGYDCIVVVSASSAEEGGYLIADPAAGAGSLTVHVQDPVQARAGLKARARTLVLGAEDRVFQLSRTDAAACKPMEQILEAP